MADETYGDGARELTEEDAALLDDLRGAQRQDYDVLSGTLE